LILSSIGIVALVGGVSTHRNAQLWSCVLDFEMEKGTRVAGFFPSMKVRLTKKLADQLDGVDVADRREGDVLDLPLREARMLVEERWAMLERREHSARDTGQRCRVDDYHWADNHRRTSRRDS